MVSHTYGSFPISKNGYISSRYRFVFYGALADQREVMYIIYYFNPIFFENLTLSIDNLVLDFYKVCSSVSEQLVMLIDKVAIQYNVQVIRWESFKPGTFREQTSVRISDCISFWIGVGLNGKKTDRERCRVEFNPNKVGAEPAFVRVLRYLLARTFPTQRKVARFDLAIDIPVAREKCFLVKDRRLYIERRHGQEFTQYLGAKSSAVGRVKLYNKAAESGLDYPLTRLELTLDPVTPYADVNFPTVYYAKTSSIWADKLRLTDTERFILNAILNGFGSLHDLGRKTRAKMQAVLGSCVETVVIPADTYASILAMVHEYEVGTIYDKKESV